MPVEPGHVRRLRPRDDCKRAARGRSATTPAPGRSSRNRAYETVKRVLDVGVAATALAATVPLQALLAGAVRATMGAPVFFRQDRPGLHGRPFQLIKLRTMRPPRPGEDPLASDADRLTALGRFLRATSLDELPTLWNVLRGEMSLVGPRPLLMEYLERYSPEQARRHEVKPGITGWAAVNGRNALSWEEKLALDVWYVDHRSLWLDLRILAKTAAIVLLRRGIAHPGTATMPEFRGTQRRGGGHG
ncbi:MAG: sugar transferase [Deltaproteobacteria bacterium]|nr:MAG: sugar transferase [Deltaproteobacteria bacterium]